MGELLMRENSDPARFAKKFCWKIFGRAVVAADSMEVTRILTRLRLRPKTTRRKTRNST
jgi:hypothetical protein